MAIFTPRGLKIRLPFNYAFTLVARLYPKVDAFKVLKTTEGLESIPVLITFIAGLLSFYFRLSLFEIGLYVFIASVVGFLVMFSGLYIISRLDYLGVFYSYVSGFGILLILLIAYGFIMVGWQGVVVFFVAKFLAGIVKTPIEVKLMKQHGELGFLTLSEEHFFNAYRIHAKRLGKTTDIVVSNEELEEENWKSVFEDLAKKWPEVVRRFTMD
ncbi:MAG: hypothetical protein KAI71_02595 [Candidatus Pacebacteria bacterium]|nr:hypothetical protein [Candidatus Paceibacterota bacterium]